MLLNVGNCNNNIIIIEPPTTIRTQLGEYINIYDKTTTTIDGMGESKQSKRSKGWV